MSPFLRFHFQKVVFFNTEHTSFHSDSPEERVQFVRISENFGHYVTFKIPNSSTNKIINRSKFRPVNGSKYPNIRADPVTSPEAIKSLRKLKFKAEDPDYDHASNADHHLPHP